MITRRAGERCEACGACEDRTVKRWLEAHERWAYDEQSGVQALRRLICLCSACHLSTHLGYANVTGRADQALAYLRAVNGMTEAEVSHHVRVANDRRSRSCPPRTPHLRPRARETIRFRPDAISLSR